MELLRFYNKQIISHLRSADKFTLTNFTHIHPTLLLHNWNNWFAKKHKTCVSFDKRTRENITRVKKYHFLKNPCFTRRRRPLLLQRIRSSISRKKMIFVARNMCRPIVSYQLRRRVSLCSCTNRGNLKRYNFNSPRAKLNSLYSIKFWLLVNVQSAAYWTNEQHLPLFLETEWRNVKRYNLDSLCIESSDSLFAQDLSCTIWRSLNKRTASFRCFMLLPRLYNSRLFVTAITKWNLSHDEAVLGRSVGFFGLRIKINETCEKYRLKVSKTVQIWIKRGKKRVA